MTTRRLPPLPFRVRDLLARHAARAAFEKLARRSAVETDLLEGALLVAQEEYPDLDPRAYRLRVEGLAQSVRERCSVSSSPSQKLEVLNDVLYEEEGFHGDRQTYYDPRNSFLNEVIDRRQGIPLTLSLLYLEVGRRQGLALHGVNFPGHFLVACRDAEHEWLIDPYERGRRLELRECAARLKAVQGEQAALEARMLRPAGPKQILYRMLNNLKGIYLKAGELGRALACAERMLLLVPDSPVDRRDRGMLLLRLDLPFLALRDLEAYLLATPTPGDAGAILERLRQVRRIHHLAS